MDQKEIGIFFSFLIIRVEVNSKQLSPNISFQAQLSMTSQETYFRLTGLGFCIYD